MSRKYARTITCKVCGLLKKNESHGICVTCYSRLPHVVARRRAHVKIPTIITCQECGQTTALEAKGMCKKCYNRIRPKKPRRVITCGTCGELKPHHAHGLCSNCHASQSGIKRKRKVIICKQCGLEGKHAARGLCNKCYYREPGRAEREREQALERYHANADFLNAQQQTRRSTPEGKTKRNTKLRSTYTINPDSRAKTIQRVLRRQDAKRGATGSHTFEEWNERLKEYNNCCAYCLKPLTKATKDHMKSIHDGGSNNIDNIVPACQSCNSRKGHRSLLIFIYDTKGKF